MRSLAEMDSPRAWKVHDLPAGPMEPIAPINILGKQEELFVSETYRFDRLGPYEHHCSDKPVGFLNLRVICAAARCNREWTRSKRDSSQEEVVSRETPDRRECAYRGLQSPVDIAQLRSDDRDIAVGITKRNQLRDGVVLDPRVRIEHQDVGRRTQSQDAPVPSGRKSSIFAPEEVNVGVSLAHKIRSTVYGVVVHDHRLVAADTVEATRDVREGVVRDDHNADIGRAITCHINSHKPANRLRRFGTTGFDSIREGRETHVVPRIN